MSKEQMRELLNRLFSVMTPEQHAHAQRLIDEMHAALEAI